MFPNVSGAYRGVVTPASLQKTVIDDDECLTLDACPLSLPQLLVFVIKVGSFGKFIHSFSWPEQVVF